MTFPDEKCDRGCGRRASWWYSGPGRDLPEAWVCDACYQAEEFKPGHVLDGDRRHFLLTGCGDCGARTVAWMTLEEVERWYHYGSVGQVLYEAYCHAWATSAPRYSSAWDSWKRPPFDPEVARLADIVREVHQPRSAAPGAAPVP